MGDGRNVKTSVSPGISSIVRLSRNLLDDSVVPKVQHSYPLGVQKLFFVLFSLSKLVRAFLNQRARRSTYRHSPGVPPDKHRTWEPGARIQLSRFQLAVIASVCSIFVYVASATGILHFEHPSLSWGDVKVMVFGMACQTSPENLALM